MGWDPHFGFQLYQSDPSGNYGGWKATCIGNNHQVREGWRNRQPHTHTHTHTHTQAAISLLKQEYKEEPPTLDKALDLAVKILYKTLDGTKFTSEKGVPH